MFGRIKQFLGYKENEPEQPLSDFETPEETSPERSVKGAGRGILQTARNISLPTGAVGLLSGGIEAGIDLVRKAKSVDVVMVVMEQVIETVQA